MIPYVTRYEPIQVTIQTDQVGVSLYLVVWCMNSYLHILFQVKNIPCGTKGGVMIAFEKIEVSSLFVLVIAMEYQFS
jgi:hypothetical protein